MKTENTILENVLDRLMDKYKQRVPAVSGIINAMVKAGVIYDESEIENDHIAFRTLGVEHLGIRSLEKIFLHHGYIKKDAYFFQEKKLDAFWYAPPQDHLPRIFISELRVQDLSQNTRKILLKYTDEVKSDPVQKLDLDNAEATGNFLHDGLWKTPTLSDYKDLAAESEYAAWVIHNKYYLNHFTISVHNLPEGYNTIASFNHFVEANGFRLNDSGGKIKQSPDLLLLQSSTVAEMVPAVFADGEEILIPGSYVEFAERRVLPEFRSLSQAEVKRQHRREGFEANNADRIFESTYTEQTNKGTSTHL